MARHVVALNVGSSQVVIAEFVIGRAPDIQLLRFATGALGLEPGAESDPSAYVVSTIRDLLRQHGIRPGPVLLSISGKDIFPRFVKLPPVGSEKIEQMVYYEAQQNVPFPIQEVVWDYQLVDREEGGPSVMLVAVKKEVVASLTDSVQAAGLDPQLVDAAPMALFNLARFQYGSRDGCTLVMDIGGRGTNLVFFEQQRLFCRCLPIAGHTITQELMKEFDLSFKDAEELKLAHAFVAFGGVTETSASPVVNRVSKTVRSVMTRLHAEVSRSINFYRSQQNGSKPSLLLLCGGSSTIPETDTFLREKLGIDVEYLNPFQSVSVSRGIPAAEVASRMHLLCEVTGLALRKAYACPMEIDLMPPELAARKRMRARMPFLSVAAVAILLAAAGWWSLTARVRRMTDEAVSRVSERILAFGSTQQELDAALESERRVTERTDRLLTLIRYRTRWLDLLADIRGGLLDGMWITSIEPAGETDPAGWSGLMIKGMGFLDKVKDAKAVGEFAAALGRTRHFSNRCKVEQIGYPAEFALEFTVSAPFKEPLALRQEP